jgi:hypothetical protein
VYATLLPAAAESQMAASSGTTDQIVLALIGLLGTSIAALVYTIRNNTIAKQAVSVVEDVNAAVNNVGPGQHRLYEMVEHIKADIIALKEGQRHYDAHGWDMLPPDLGTSVALTSTIRDIQYHTASVTTKLDTLIDEVRSHVEWEMQQKWSDPSQ